MRAQEYNLALWTTIKQRIAAIAETEDDTDWSTQRGLRYRCNRLEELKGTLVGQMENGLKMFKQVQDFEHARDARLSGRLSVDQVVHLLGDGGSNDDEWMSGPFGHADDEERELARSGGLVWKPLSARTAARYQV